MGFGVRDSGLRLTWVEPTQGREVFSARTSMSKCRALESTHGCHFTRRRHASDRHTRTEALSAVVGPSAALLQQAGDSSLFTDAEAKTY